MTDHLTLASGFNTSAYIRPAVYLHEAVWTVARDTKEATRPMVFEAAREDTLTGSIKSGRDTLSSERRNSPAVEGESERLLRINEQARGMRRRTAFLHVASPPSLSVWITSFVRRSRSAVSQQRQPNR